MIDDLTLLRRYARDGDDDAFREVVQRYLALVYSAALRQVGTDRHLVEDVAQGVFCELARQAGQLSPGVVLAGWLFRTTRFVTANIMRSEERRRRRETAAIQEQEIHAMSAIEHAEEQDWSSLQCHLDAAVSELNEKDRSAILLRFFQGMDFRAVGTALGVSDDTAQKRVARALDKLRDLLGHRVAAPSAVGLALWLTHHAISAPPPGLAESVMTHVLATGGAVAGGFAAGLQALLRKKMAWLTGALSVGFGLLLLQTLSARTVTPPPGLIAWWQAEGDARDRVSGRPGILLTDSAFAPGRTGQAFRFGSHSSGVHVPYGGAFDIGTAPGLTIELWIQPFFATQPAAPGLGPEKTTTPLVEWSMGPAWGAVNNGQWWGAHLHIMKDTQLILNLTDISGAWRRVIAPPAVIAPGIWHHVAVTFEKASGVVRLYLNGKVVADRFEPGDALSGFTPDTRGELFLGHRPGGEEAFSFFGLMDEVSLYARALTGDEIAMLAGAAAKRDVAVAPTILSEPDDQGENNGGTVRLQVRAGGAEPLQYQWWHNGAPVPDGQRPTLELTNVGPGHAGAYFVTVGNAAGTVTSAVARVTTEPAAAAAGLVAWWRAEGDAEDVFGGGAGEMGEGVGFGRGRCGRGFVFDGRGDGMRMPGRPALDVGPGPGFTVEAWVKPVHALGKFPLTGWNETGAGASAGVNLALLNGRIYARLRDRRGQAVLVVSSDAPVTTNRWHHVALVFDAEAQETRLHCDGRTVGRELSGPFVPDTTGDFFLGYRPGPAKGETAPPRFVGGMDEVSLYNRPLNEDELAAIARAGGAGKRTPHLALQNNNLSPGRSNP